MKRIKKSPNAPAELGEYVVRFSSAPSKWTWDEFKKKKERKEPVKNQLRIDQRGLCAYCENSLIPSDETVEHLMPRSAGHEYELAWDNLLLCCTGGAAPIPLNAPVASARYDPNSRTTCGQAKLAASTLKVHPLMLLAFPRIYRFKSQTGEIVVDPQGCQAHDISVSDAEDALVILRLREGRLNRAREALIKTLEELLEDGDSPQAFTTALEQQIASCLIPASGELPAFFTTIRWCLGVGCEIHLQSINFGG